MTLQYFVNYNLPQGWYLSSAPLITADWEAKRTADTWTVPIGGGVGKLLRLWPMPVNTQVQAYWKAETPRARRRLDAAHATAVPVSEDKERGRWTRPYDRA